MSEFKLPDVGEGLTEAEILTWHVKPGDTVVVNQTIVEIETAKAAVELPCPYAGVVAEVFVAEGDLWRVNASGGVAQRLFLRSRANSIEGGTSEVNLNVVSKRVRQMSKGQRPMVEVGVRADLCDIALREIIEGKLVPRAAEDGAEE